MTASVTQDLPNSPGNYTTDYSKKEGGNYCLLKDGQ